MDPPPPPPPPPLGYGNGAARISWNEGGYVLEYAFLFAQDSAKPVASTAGEARCLSAANLIAYPAPVGSVTGLWRDIPRVLRR